MTAEIAILNKLAVALAADSAVTVGRPPNAKIYNTVNKIFELSAFHPIGVMVYGRLDFMGVPYEALLKEYRKQLGSRSFQRVADYRDDLRRFLAAEVMLDDEDRRVNLEQVLANFFARLDRVIQNTIWTDVRAQGVYKKSKVNGLAQNVVRAKIKALKATDFAAGFSKKMLPAEAVPTVDSVIDRYCGSWAPTEGTKALLRDYAGYVIAKRKLSPDLRSGIVIAGFGDADIFPSLETMELDGILLGKLKYIDGQSVDIDRRGPEADVLGFAQDDMVKSFVDGVDPALRRYVDELLESGVQDTAKLVLDGLISDPVQRDALYDAFENKLADFVSELYKKIDRRVELTSSRPIKDMVRAMPKQELGTLASSLIEITSLKRKVSRGQETVGGEVDVAIISKSEGFVWTKRKHYFPPELNMRYFNRLDSARRSK